MLCRQRVTTVSEQDAERRQEKSCSGPSIPLPVLAAAGPRAAKKNWHWRKTDLCQSWGFAQISGSAHMLTLAFVPALPWPATGGGKWDVRAEGGCGRSQHMCFWHSGMCAGSLVCPDQSYLRDRGLWATGHPGGNGDRLLMLAADKGICILSTKRSSSYNLLSHFCTD